MCFLDFCSTASDTAAYFVEDLQVKNHKFTDSVAYNYLDYSRIIQTIILIIGQKLANLTHRRVIDSYIVRDIVHYKRKSGEFTDNFFLCQNTNMFIETAFVFFCATIAIGKIAQHLHHWQHCSGKLRTAVGPYGNPSRKLKYQKNVQKGVKHLFRTIFH